MREAATTEAVGRPADGLGRDRQRFFLMLTAARAARAAGYTAERIEFEVVEADRNNFGDADLIESHWQVGEAVARAVGMALCEPRCAEGERSPDRLALGSEVEIARRVLEDAEPDDPKWVAASGAVWQYDHRRGVWGRVPDDGLRRRIMAWDGAEYTSDKGKRARVKLSSRAVNGIVSCVTMQRAQPGFFDDERDGVVFQDAFVELAADGDLLVSDHSPDHRARVAMPWQWPGEDAEPEGFIMALRGIWADRPEPEALIQLLREWVGAMLAGISTRYSRGLFLSGPGGTGKSTILKVVIGLVPADAVCSIGLQKMSSDYHVAAMAGKRLNAMPDLSYAAVEDTGAIKAAMTGDLVGARSPYHEPFSFHPRCGHLASANARPGTADHSTGWLRRWLPVDCTRVLSDTEGEIKDLDKILLQAEGGKIAAWALAGARDLVARGRYEIPRDVAKALGEWQRRIDPVAEWVEDHCERIDPDADHLHSAWWKASELHRAYCEWAGRSRYKDLSTRALFERLESIGITKKKRRDANYWALREASMKGWN